MCIYIYIQIGENSELKSDRFELADWWVCSLQQPTLMKPSKAAHVCVVIASFFKIMLKKVTG